MPSSSGTGGRTLEYDDEQDKHLHAPVLRRVLHVLALRVDLPAWERVLVCDIDEAASGDVTLPPPSLAMTKARTKACLPPATRQVARCTRGCAA